tara:strand:- start:91 stop:300 length:210 start_codon:yes stop_codon:yes gene_type:complete
MFDVEHEDDAWELGVLKARGFFDSPNGSKSAEELGVPSTLVEFFEAGLHDHHALSEERVFKFACQWEVA